MSDTRCFHCGARTVAFQQAVAELAAVTQELHERDEQHRRVMDSPCPDEQHCTCVPILRAEIEQLEAENQKLRDTNQRLCERPQLRVNVEALVDDVERLEAENQKLRGLNDRALHIITDAIMHGMPVTTEVAAVRNGICETSDE